MSKKHHTVRFADGNAVYIDNEYAGSYLPRCGLFVAHFRPHWETSFRSLKADTRSGLRRLISETINADELIASDGLVYDYLDYLYMEIGLLPEDVAMVPLAGCADDACDEIADKQYVIDQLADKTDKELFEAVRSLCDNPELTSRKQAIEYIVWVLACGIKESKEWTDRMGHDAYLISLPKNGKPNVVMIKKTVKTMANITNSAIRDWANEHDEDFAAKVKNLKMWRLLYAIARMYDLETVDDEGVSHGTARDNLPRGSFHVVHELIDGVIAGDILSKADLAARRFSVSMKWSL
jgi:hypothetical protein